MTKYSISSDCFHSYVCRESHVFRMAPSDISEHTAPEPEDPCLVEEVYITLGDRFADPTSSSLFRLAFRISSKQCLSQLELKFFAVSPTTGELSAFQKEESLYEEEQRVNSESRKFYLRHYRFEGVVQGQNYKMDNLYVFTDIEKEDLPDPGFFAYSFSVKDLVVKGPFVFESKVVDYLEGREDHLEVVTFGDHDSQEQGTFTINALNAEDAVDLYLLLGDYAYETFDDNGEKGRLYFSEMEPILARQPVLMIAGNHEWFDEFAFFYSKMTFPGDPYLGDSFLFTDPDRDYSFTSDMIRSNLPKDVVERSSPHSYHLTIRDIFILSVNVDLLLSQEILFARYLARLNLLLESTTKMRHKIFTSHRPIYCSQVQLFVKDCLFNYYILQPLNALLMHFDFNLVLMAHLHHYERLIPLEDFRPAYLHLPESPRKSLLTRASANPLASLPPVSSTTIVSGSAGCAHLFIKFERLDIEYLIFQRQVTPGFVSLSFYTQRESPLVLARFIPSTFPANRVPMQVKGGVPAVFEYHSPLDWVLVSGLGPAEDSRSTEIVFLILAGFLVIAVLLVFLSRRRFQSPRKKKMERLRHMKSQYSTMSSIKPPSLMEDEGPGSQSLSLESLSRKPLESEGNLLPK